MDGMKARLRDYLPFIGLIGAVLLILLNFSVVIQYLGKLLTIIQPLLVGLIMAYILNILMVKYEKSILFRNPNTRLQKAKRGISLLLALISIVGIIYFVSLLILPQLFNAIKILVGNFPTYYNKGVEWISQNVSSSAVLDEVYKGINFKDGKEVIQNILRVIGTWTGSLVGVVSGFFSTVFNLVIALIFAIYILTSKEKLQSQAQSLMNAYLSCARIKQILRVLNLSHQVFTNFVIGQCMEAVILGALCALGMAAFRLPYATMVGSVVGITALIPMVGAYLGAAIGAFMVLTVSPIQTVIFLIFIVVLQQLENNLIYPRVVGSSVGLPGIWVLVAVTIGGGLFGVTGILFSVPVAAVFYQLLRDDVAQKNKSHLEDNKNKR